MALSPEKDRHVRRITVSDQNLGCNGLLTLIRPTMLSHIRAGHQGRSCSDEETNMPEIGGFQSIREANPRLRSNALVEETIGFPAIGPVMPAVSIRILVLRSQPTSARQVLTLQLRKKPRKRMVLQRRSAVSCVSSSTGKLIHYRGAKLKVPDKPAALRYFRMRGSILRSFLLYDPQVPNCSFTSTVRPRYFQAIGDANGCR